YLVRFERCGPGACVPSAMKRLGDHAPVKASPDDVDGHGLGQGSGELLGASAATVVVSEVLADPFAVDGSGHAVDDLSHVLRPSLVRLETDRRVGRTRSGLG